MDYYTSALIEPQKGDPVKLPIQGEAPISSGDAISKLAHGLNFELDTPIPVDTVRNLGVANAGASPTSTSELFAHTTTDAATNISKVVGTNLVADLTNATATTVNDLRMAFQLQKLLEKDARGGTRYTEIINYQFGVQSDDARLQRPEFLSGTSTPIQIGQVLQTSGTAEGQTPQANVSGYSLTGASNYTGKSFTEHGTVIGLISIRQKHTYQQALNKY